MASKENEFATWFYRTAIAIAISVFGFYYNKNADAEQRQKEKDEADKKEMFVQLNRLQNGQTIMLSQMDAQREQLYNLNQKQDLDNENLQGIHMELTKKVPGYYFNMNYGKLSYK